jgi:hypothetical protein
LRVRVQVLLPQSCTHADRRALAERLRQDIDAALA